MGIGHSGRTALCDSTLSEESLRFCEIMGCSAQRGEGRCVDTGSSGVEDDALWEICGTTDVLSWWRDKKTERTLVWDGSRWTEEQPCIEQTFLPVIEA